MATFLAQMMKDFKKPGQTTAEFGAEFKALSPDDREWFKNAYKAEGIEFTG